MGKLVQPETFFIGYTTIEWKGLLAYLEASDNKEFFERIDEARQEGLSEGEMLTSFYAKLCYASLTEKHNKNISKTRSIKDNLLSTLDSAHGSVFEHVTLNFVIRNCSRVLTHELVRHRAGTSYSQTSGRYVRGDEIDIVFDPILEPVRDQVKDLQYIIEEHYAVMVEEMDLDNLKDFSKKKKITSALRRLLPNGQSNEIGFSVNLRALRHIVQLRTSRQAEWEIRLVFNQIYTLVKDKYPLLFYGAKEEEIEGLLEISGMKLQPYEKVE